ncbi:MAG: cob(I)alamin adenosyltransferase [Candidatus Atribacteria bacterium]|nr:cob(I)alamin adenosyltransferase [Candidatus Atribacteria bacterium]
MTDDQGLIQVYFGNGKGKTTASLGVALRALGHSLRVLFVQFFKRQFTGEMAAFQCIPQAEFYQFGSGDFLLGREINSEDQKEFRAGWELAKRALHEGTHRLVILDEISYAFAFNLLNWEELEQVLRERKPQVEVVITGRRVPEQLIDMADLVTEMREIKHPYTKGIKAREGFEF